MANEQQAINSINNSTMPTMLHLLKSGIKNKIEPGTPKNITLVLGLAGSYKRDLIKFISGNEQLNNSWDDSAISSTTFPGLIIDSKTNTAIYEYPKFGQSKTLEEEISAKYLLNEIIDYADSIKLIFTIPESQNESGLDDEHIDSLLDESVKLIKNFNELKDSIALVVTRVDKNDSVSDEDVIKNISADLMDLKKYSDSGNASDLKKQNLIDILLREKHGIYTNIGVFKKPGTFEEKVSEKEVLDDDKKSLKTVINANTKFIVHDKNNFQCAFCSDESLKNMTYLQSDLSNNVREIKQIVLKHFENLEKDLDDIKLIYDAYSSIGHFFDKLHSKISSSSIEKFPTELINLENLFQNIHIKIPKGIILSINNCAEYLSLFLKISNFKSSNYSEAIAGIDLFRKYFDTLIDDIPRELRKSQNWYRALRGLHGQLSRYNVQEDSKSKQSDRDYLMNQISTLKSQLDNSATCDVDEIDEVKLEKAYFDMKRRIFHQIEQIFKFVPENDDRDIMRTFFYGARIKRSCKDKIRILSKILESLFYSASDEMRKSCEDGIFTIKGQFVKLSDVSDDESIKKPHQCNDMTNVTEIRLFASNTVYIDRDLTINMTADKLQLSIIAPRWEVLGKRQIVLLGKPAKEHTSLTAPSPNSVFGQHNGFDGEPGNRGGPAGNFLAIGSSLVRDYRDKNPDNSYLSVLIKGGHGGRGQNGSNGISGAVISAKTIPKRDENDHVRIDLVKNCTLKEKNYYRCTDQSNTCEDGGSGGRGGAGGWGGQTGNYKIIDLFYNSENSDIKVARSMGQRGSDGTPGIPGKGGKGLVLTYNLKTDGRPGTPFGPFAPFLGLVWLIFLKHNDDKIPDSHEISSINPIETRCKDGQKNSTLNPNVMEVPKYASDARISADAINDYKRYLRDLGVKPEDKVRGQSLRNFLNDIEKSPLVRELYNVEELANDLKSLETQFYVLRKEVSFLPLYESLLDRITEYANRGYEQKKSENDGKKEVLDDDESKALRYLYTATLSKIFSIREKKSSNLILDIETFLELALENIDKLNEYKKIKLMTEAHKKYYSSLNTKIEEAKHFNSDLMEEINICFANLDKKIESLIVEAQTMERKVENQRTNLTEMKKKIKNAILLKSMFAVPKMIGAFLNFAGPVGSAAGAALTGSMMVIESLSVKNVNKDDIKTTKLPAEFKKNMANMEKLFDQQKMFQAQLKAIAGAFNTTEKISQPPSTVLKLNETISSYITRSVEEEKQGGVSPEKVSERIDKVTELLEKQAEELGDEKYKDDKKVQAWSKRMNRAVNVMKIVQVPLSLYKDIAEDNEKSDLIIDAYKESEDQLKKLDTYKKNIIDKIIPQCRELQTFLTNELSGDNITKSRSLAGLDIKQWKMQDMLKDSKNFMFKITEGFEVQEDITRLFEKIDHALFTMIDIYRCMEDYRDKKELADYIKNINPDNDMEEIENAALKNAIDDLKVIIQSNIVLEEYERTIHAFNQIKYPMANQFLDKYRLPVDRGFTSFNVDKLTTASAKILQDLRAKFKENEITVVQDDQYWHDIQPFVVRKKKDTRRGAFYIWKYAENKHAISELLEGKEVMLKSDIAKSKPEISAVKFQVIDFKFKFANKTVEKEFRKKLKRFDLRMIHLGKSQYKCNDKFHLITNDEQDFTIEFGTSRGNRVYDKVKKNEPLLSPYTSWKLSLISRNHRGFAPLKKYQNMKIDLALEGTGTYLDHTTMKEADLNRICSDDLSKYYNEEKTILRINSTELSNREVIDELPGLGDPIITVQKNRSRKPRSLGDHEFEQDLEEDPISTSGACSNMKSSFINNIFNLIGTGLVAYEYLNPVNKISQWFARKYETDSDREDSFVLDSDLPASSSMKMLNVQYPATESPKISKMFIDDELPTTNNLLSDSSFCNHGNLLLLDLVIRSKSGVKYSHPSFAANSKVDPEYAQRLAYSEHRK